MSEVRRVSGDAPDDPRNVVYRTHATDDSLAFEVWGNDTDAADRFAGELVGELVDRGYVADAKRGRIEIALKEALHNAVLHGNLEVDSELKRESFEPFEEEVERRRQRKTFQIRSLEVAARFEDEAATITIRDQGGGFDPELVADPAETDPTKLHGRGLAMIRSFVDSVTFNDAGNEISLRVKRPA